MENKISLLSSKRDSYFKRIQSIYDSIPKTKRDKIALFLMQAANIQHLRDEFVELNDSIHACHLDLDPKYEPKFELLWEFDDMFYAIKSVFKKLSDSDDNAASAAASAAPAFKLPRIDIPDFDGDIQKFPLFIESFRTIVHNNPALGNAERIHYLISKLKGKAQSICVGIAPTPDNYRVLYETLVDKYEDKRAIAISYLENILNLKPLSAGKANAANLESYIDQFSTSVAALRQLNIKEMSDFIFVHLALRKLDSETSKAFEMSLKDNEKFPKYDDFVKFIRDQTKILQRTTAVASPSHPHAGNHAQRNQPSPAPRTHFVQNKMQTFLVNNNENPIRVCSYCNSNKHANLYQCEPFLRLTPIEKYNVIKKCNGCVNCLSVRHTLSTCKSNTTCKYCHKAHHSQLCRNALDHPNASKQGDSNFKDYGHSYNANKGQFRPPAPLPVNQPASSPATAAAAPPARPHAAASPSSVPYAPAAASSDCTRTNNSDVGFSGTATSNQDSFKTVLLGTAIVQVLDAFGNRRDIRVLVDMGSQNHFITSRCLRTLGLKLSPDDKNISVHGIGESSQSIKGTSNLTLFSRFDDSFSFDLQALVIDKISGNLPACEINTACLDYLKDIPFSDSHWYMPGKIDLLLGAEDFVKCIMKNNRIIGPPGLPDAIETVFGYVISGSAYTTSVQSSTVQTFFTATDKVDTLLSKFWEIEEVPTRKHLSADDKACEQIYSQQTTRDDLGRYVVPLPFCRDPCDLGDSLPTAMRRYKSLERRFKQNNVIHQQYDEIIRDYLQKEYISLVKDLESNPSAYIIPHHPVIKEDRLTTKVRIVLDASASTSTDISLNDCLYTGPNLQSDLLAIIFDFRLFPIAITADIRQMYLRILVSPEFHRYLRMIYRFSNESEPQIYEFNRVCFGLKCSPYLAMRTVKQLLLDEGSSFPAAASVASRNLYMDDLGTSVMDESTAIELSRDLIALFSRAGLELVKFSSNSRSLLEHLPEDNRLSAVVDISDDTDLKILGLRWCPVADQFSITVNLDPQNVVTKRTILSTIAKLWDLVGIAAPIILYAKLLIKTLWLLKLDWDEPLPGQICAQWSQFKAELLLLKELKFPRHLGINTSDCELTLVGFSDASTVAYGAVVYLCVSHPIFAQNIVNIVCAKSKVAPVKVLTLARLELCAALLLAKLIRYVSDNISNRCKISNIYAFTDSSVTLQWIHSSPHRFNVFVSNRIAQINEYLPASHFFHVSGKENPSDCLSRGLTPSQLLVHSLWLNGPSWMKESMSQWPLDHFIFDEHQVIPEVKMKAQTFLTTDKDEPFLHKLATRFSSWSKFLRVVVYVFRFMKKIPRSDRIKPADIEIAEKAVLASVQSVHFDEDVRNLQSHKTPSKGMQKLCPFLSDGLLLVGGRLNKSDLEFFAKHPILLPNNDHVVNLLVDAYHKRFLHAGPNLMLSLLRQRYWILSGRNLVRKRFRLCNHCFKVSPSIDSPLMADLPSCRVTEAKPFIHTGVDYAGPLPILLSRYRGARQQKAYICLFICLVTRCTHIELAVDLSTSAFINAFKRFVSRRGTCLNLYSDQGTNFIGAKAYFDELSQLTHSKEYKDAFSNEVLQQGINWRFNPPSAPHFGGSWESNIRSIKLHLKRVIGDQLLTYEEMLTVLTQIESVLNSRPLTLLNADPSEPTALTPSHFLTLGPVNSLHNVDVSSLSLNLVKRKYLLDKIIQSFWKRWRVEYLHTLQMRQKWNTASNPITKGTIVLLNIDNVPPLKWPLGVIEDVFPGKDGVIRVVSANATPEFEGRGGEQLANSIANLMQRAYHSSQAFDLKQLSILEGKQCWKLYIDILLKVTQAIERTRLGVSLRDRIRNGDIRSRTKVTDIALRVAKLKWQRAVCRPPTRWSDDLVKIAGLRWIRKAQDRSEWRALGEAYVQQWTTFG
ncbi:hypothetical protein MSG28_005461 [Choristoneura fumiferana]|uniref:Uncharacterized protein n=1 Tax=Choristoneura fumiferana TaxID=7141 RepID=A0ACC0KZ46_CHOFU|nr:hypothetical protein MSG28_005461 [Choristoneura fumiferana]